MSRVSNHPIPIPPGVEVNISGQTILIKGAKGSLSYCVHELVGVARQDNTLTVSARNASKSANMLAGTSRALLSNMVRGVSAGFERKLEITGVGYRAQVQGRVLNLTLGYSHPISFAIPEGISIETPSPAEIIIKGIDKQKVGQIAAKIRSQRPPEPYKGKGIRFSDEVIVRKEAKKT
jgi:large subunit ribosomal protein L6